LKEKRLLVRPRSGWKDNIKVNFTNEVVKIWTGLNHVQWRRYGKVSSGTIKPGNFLTAWETIIFSKNECYSSTWRLGLLTCPTGLVCTVIVKLYEPNIILVVSPQFRLSLVSLGINEILTK
jgi:hypothetical protein